MFYLWPRTALCSQHAPHVRADISKSARGQVIDERAVGLDADMRVYNYSLSLTTTFAILMSEPKTTESGSQRLHLRKSNMHKKSMIARCE